MIGVDRFGEGLVFVVGNFFLFYQLAILVDILPYPDGFALVPSAYFAFRIIGIGMFVNGIERDFVFYFPFKFRGYAVLRAGDGRGQLSVFV